MSSSWLCGALTLLGFVHDGTSFLRPAFRVGDELRLVRNVWDKSSCDTRSAIVSSHVGADSYRRSNPRKSRDVGVYLMAKKRRRRRLEDVNPNENGTAPESELQGNVAPTHEVLAGEREVDEEGKGEEDGGLRAVVMPPLPSELGADALRISQELQGEDMMSPAAYQPKPEVADVEINTGGPTDLMDEPSAKDSKYSFELEVELPMESENREADEIESTLTADSPMAPDGVMPLPDLRDLAKKSRSKTRQKEVTKVTSASKVERRNVAAFTKLLELDPEADSEEALFTTESYDAFSSILGEGKPFVGIANSYLQSGHTVLLGLVLLCGFVELPGFPLTSLPYDVREFLKTGLLVVYVINTGIAFLSYLEAKRVGQPAAFWAVKGFVLGGLAFNELSQVEPPKAKKLGGGRKRRG